MSFYVTYPSTSVSSGPIQFYLDGSPVYVSEDTGTPANSVPLPVTILGPSGIPIGFTNDYGASANALRTASQIGNTTGAADFNAGATGIQTLRVEANQGAASATPWPVTGPLTDTQLRATPVPVSGTVTATGPLTDTQLRATPVPISGTVTANAGTNLNTSALALETTQVANGVLVGAVNETAPATDTASSGLNGRLQRIAQRITSLIALFPTSLGQKTMAGSLAVTVASDQSAIPVSPSAGASGNSPGSTTVSTVATITAPANALGFILMNLDTSSANIRYRIGAAATASSGQQMQPGRDTGFVPCGANISICAESGTQNYDIQWIIK